MTEKREHPKFTHCPFGFPEGVEHKQGNHERLGYELAHKYGCLSDAYFVGINQTCCLIDSIRINGGWLHYKRQFIDKGKVKLCEDCKPDLQEIEDAVGSGFPESRTPPRTYAEAAKYLVKTGSCVPDFESLYEGEDRGSCGYHYFNDPSPEDSRLFEYPLYETICTDTHVGEYLLFLDDEFVALKQYHNRKSDTEVTYVSKEAKDLVRAYVKSFLEEEEEEEDEEDFLGDEAMPAYVSFGGCKTLLEGTGVVHRGRVGELTGSSAYGYDRDAKLPVLFEDTGKVEEVREDELIVTLSLDWDRVNADKK